MRGGAKSTNFGHGVHEFGHTTFFKGFAGFKFPICWVAFLDFVGCQLSTTLLVFSRAVGNCLSRALWALRTDCLWRSIH